MRIVRRLRLAAFALLAFTNPQGVTVFIDSGSVASVGPGASNCIKPELTHIDLGQSGYCVKESIADVVAKVNEAEEADGPKDKKKKKK